MIIYYSMILWTMFMGVLNSFANFKPTTNISRKYSVIHEKTEYKPVFIFAFLAMGYIVFFCGMRTGISDTYLYIDIFENLTTNFTAIIHSDSQELGWTIFQYIIKVLFNGNFHAFLLIVAAISGFGVFIPIYKKSPSVFFSIVLFMLSGTFIWMLNGIRQFMAAAVIFACYKFLEKGQFIKYLLVVLLMSTIHTSCLIMIPIYFIVRAKPWGTKVIVFIVGIILAIQFIGPLTTLLGNALEGTVYEGATAQFAQDDGVNPIRVIVAIVPALIGLLKKKQIEEMNDMFINISINMSLLSAGFYLLGVFTSGVLVGRIPIYFTLYSLISLPYMFKKCFKSSEQLFLYVSCFAGYAAYFYLTSNNLFYVSDFTGIVR